MTTPDTTAADCELTLTRTFEVPRELVYKAWTNPQHVKEWWGPKDFTNPVCEMDVRPGGKWRIVMRGPDGSEYPSHGLYQEVVPDERLVLTDCFEMEPKPVGDSTWTVTFEEHDAKTRLTIVVRCQSVEDRDTMIKMGWRGGTSQMLDRFADYLPKVLL